MEQLCDYETNPFEITKAVDFNDKQIQDFWVDITGGFNKLVKPTSSMSMFILGGKGSGKTHIMRYFSYAIQKMRYTENIVPGLKKEQYIGIYLLCSGLNSERFKERGLTDQRWYEEFVYYFELNLVIMLLKIVHDAFYEYELFKKNEDIICSEIMQLFDYKISGFSNMNDIIEYFDNLKKEIDIAINNMVFNKNLDIVKLFTRSNLIFGIPRIFTKYLTLGDMKFLYLIDEFENLTELQQKFINSLIRERQDPVSFKVGARLYGIKTYSISNDDELNREGSEYETLLLDNSLRSYENDYSRFIKDLCIKRLIESNYLNDSQKIKINLINGYFEVYSKNKYYLDETKFVIDKYKDKKRPYFEKLKKDIKNGLDNGIIKDISKEEDINEIIQMLEVHDYPLLEKLNILIFYIEWRSGKNLYEASKEISLKCKNYIDNKGIDKQYDEKFRHFKTDMLAQLYRDCRKKQEYIGIDTFISMSHGIPRNFLMIMKKIFEWSVFKEEEPFKRDKIISISSQVEAVSKASEWFYDQSITIGDDGKIMKDSVNRLLNFLSTIRFSDIPSECSLSAFSINETEITEETSRIIELMWKWSLIIEMSHKRDKNSRRIDRKFQINRMLAPQLELPIAVRGVISLTTEEANSIFDQAHSSEFEHIRKKRVEKMNAPFFGKRKNERKQSLLFND
ncbi:MAG: hypothetical protein HQL02_03150 [Nitrospirae bacterium]|nr:hypothetical protein [Nitrospirota bacterium]